ncbi:MAG: FecR domain-containing protein [Tannerella sp.]|jgi:ferric-dicitrate binding protein FerR (iron transport regulator)|nr:FecR domain-containing protein [Tannerella sp.]
MENYINQLIAKVLSGEATSEEIIRFSQWLSDGENNQDEFCKLKSYWDAEISYNHAITSELSLQKMQHQIQTERRRKKKRKIFYHVSIALSFVFLTGAGLFYINSESGKKNVPDAYFTYLTGNNKTSFTLADGTKIHLNKNSRLIYTDCYSKTDRFVKLEGEAYFEVQRNAEIPFVVKLGDTQIKVFGTSFSVRKDGQANILATLIEGAIRFETPDQQVMLAPGQQLVYTNSSNRIEIASVNIDDELDWTEGIIRHKSVLFFDLICDLEKRFDVKINIRNEQLKKSSISMTGAFLDDQSLEHILKVISITYPFKWEKTDHIYYID